MVAKNWDIVMFCKRFVPARKKTHEASGETEKSTPVRGDLTGNQAMGFYLNVVNDTRTQTSRTDTQQSAPPPSFPRSKKPTAPSTLLKVTDKLMERFLFASQSDETLLLREILKVCPQIINITDNFGWTGLMCAVQGNAIRAVEFLVKSGADLYTMDKKGRTALSLAKSPSIVKLLMVNNKKPSQMVSNSIETKLTLCKICSEYVKSNELKKHASSTIHILNWTKSSTSKTHYGIPESNKGFQMLIKEGWDRESGLGPHGFGHKFPIKTSLKKDRSGIGAKKLVSRVTHFTANDKKAITNREERTNTISKRKRQKLIENDRLFEIKMRMEFS